MWVDLDRGIRYGFLAFLDFKLGFIFLLFDARVGNRNGFRRCGIWCCGL